MAAFLNFQKKTLLLCKSVKVKLAADEEAAVEITHLIINNQEILWVLPEGPVKFSSQASWAEPAGSC